MAGQCAASPARMVANYLDRSAPKKLRARSSHFGPAKIVT
jgi:hypothetical protein